MWRRRTTPYAPLLPSLAFSCHSWPCGIFAVSIPPATSDAPLSPTAAVIARTWVESGDYLAFLSFRVVDPAMAALPASEHLLRFVQAPIDVVTVALEPAR